MMRTLTDRFGRILTETETGLWETEGLTIRLADAMIDADIIERFNNMSPVTPSDVPTFVSPLQMRRALRRWDLKDTVDAFVATLDVEIQEAWEYATQINRTDPLIAIAQAALGLSDEQADELFRLASTL